MSSWLLDMLIPELPPERPQWEKELTFPLGSLPVNEINQTWLSTYRECHAKGKWFGITERKSSPYYMFTGSVYHQAMDEAIGAPDLDRWLHNTKDPLYWFDVFNRVWQLNDASTYEDIDYDKFARRLSKASSRDEIFVGQLIYRALLLFRASGFEILHAERRMKYEIPGGTPYTGTLDIQAYHKAFGLILGDTKSEGLAKWLFFGKASNKTTYTESQVSDHMQLTHYNWLGDKLGLWDHREVARYMIHTPTNLTEYTRGSDAGSMKGAAFHFGKPPVRGVERYEEDMKSWLKMAHAGHFERLYPSNFGKLTCGSCPYSGVCIDTKTTDYVPDYIPRGD